ncbi:MAG: hypothetical protein WBA93_11105 [Microcoleaceae cyanobacterium]
MVYICNFHQMSNGRQSFNTLANQLTKEISNSIEQHVLGYLNKSYQVLRITNDAIESSNLDIYDFGAMRLFFLQKKEINLESEFFFSNE